MREGLGGQQKKGGGGKFAGPAQRPDQDGQSLRRFVKRESEERGRVVDGRRSPAVWRGKKKFCRKRKSLFFAENADPASSRRGKKRKGQKENFGHSSGRLKHEDGKEKTLL